MRNLSATDFFEHFGQMFVESFRIRRPAVKCEDGYQVSIQASEYHYCSPRETGLNHYDEVELGFPNKADEELLDYAEEPEKPTDTVYGYVPIDLVDKVIMKHGGITKLIVSGFCTDHPIELEVSVF